MAQDDENAEAYLERFYGNEPQIEEAGPPLTEFSLEAQYLAAAVDRLGELINVQVATSGGKPVTVKPLPRPVTAIDRARKRWSEAAQNRVRNMFGPKTEG